ncbi:MAG: ABC-2 family transporter protein [Oligoflexia bacterium]|nr:ABC-2 family transporter protein [Oligoflexia bacterium]
MKTLLTYLQLTVFILRQGLIAAMQYRVSFVMQIGGMIVNDIFWLLLWILYFQRFPEVNGWRFEDSALLLAISCTTFGIFMFMAWGLLDLARKIAQGELDYYLSMPRNTLWHVSLGRLALAGLGDLLFGIMVFLCFCRVTWQNGMVFVVVSLLAAWIVYSFVVLTQSICFFTGNFERAASHLFWTLVTFGLYPYSAFEGLLKIITVTLLPAYFIYAVPVRLVKVFSLRGLVEIGVFALALFALAVFTFNRGLRRYESGNSLALRR